MLVFAGIDEAGYGPRLGPLCVGATAFVLADHDPAEGPPNLWQQLRPAVCRKPSDRKRRVAVDDSKKLKGSGEGRSHPLRALERGVLSFLPDDPPPTDADLLRALGTDVPTARWYESGLALPLGQTSDEIRIARARVQRALARAGIRCDAMACVAVDAADFNRRLSAGDNKAEVNFAAAADLLETLWRRYPTAHPRVIVDRHGGRTSYGELLAAHLPGAAVETVAETPTLSRYRLSRGGSRLTVSFALDGDCRFLPASLASMTAKFVRDLMMLRLNRFFCDQVPDLKPTWGYYGDAGRYLVEINPVMRRLRLAPSELVRRV